jgi:hypothetical protein
VTLFNLGTDNILATPVVSDIDGDGKPEIIIQGMNDSCNQSILYVYNNRGELLSGWPRVFGNGAWSSPIAANINGDSLDEIIACSHINVDSSIVGKLGVFAFDKTGQLINGWPIELEYNGYGYYAVDEGLAAADINNDGFIEILATSAGYDYSLWVIDHEGNLVWNLESRPFEFVMNSIPIIADINSDGKLEIIFSKKQNIPDQYGRIIVVDNEGQTIDALSRIVAESIRGTPSISDIDGDNKIDIVTGTTSGLIYSWGFDSPFNSQTVIWPTYQGNNCRTGRYSRTSSDAVPNVLLSGVPKEYQLSDVYPNPFNPSAKFEYSLPEQSQLNVGVYNLLGQKVDVLLDQKMDAGHHVYEWNASRFSSGIYFLRFSAIGIRSGIQKAFCKKMMLLK